jgi:hypothetical protein
MTQENEPQEPQGSYTDLINDYAPHLEAQEAIVNQGLVGSINARDKVTVVKSVAGGIAAGSNAEVLQSGCGGMAVGHDATIQSGAVLALTVGGDANIQSGGGGVVVCRNANLENSVVGVLFTPQASLGKDVKVLMTAKQAAAFGAAFGLVAGIFSLITRRRR